MKIILSFFFSLGHDAAYTCDINEKNFYIPLIRLFPFSFFFFFFLLLLKKIYLLEIDPRFSGFYNEIETSFRFDFLTWLTDLVRKVGKKRKRKSKRILLKFIYDNVLHFGTVLLYFFFHPDFLRLFFPQQREHFASKVYKNRW